ncbi:uncharacterized protein [Nicotiana sylvestris]|uniref:uncharacterized protein n=1 Tax=Nicotiana sylvestris TaxID=4096 RepID=UPI00388C795A
MFFYLTTLSLQKFIKEDVHVLPDETAENEHFLVIEAWKHSDFLCKNYVLSGLEDDLYNVYSGVETSKELWAALEKKYKTEDGINQINTDIESSDLSIFTNRIFIEALVINEAFQVAVMIEKLSPLWKDFKNHLKHERKEMSLEDLIVRLRIKEDNKAAEKKGHENSAIMGANIVEDTSQNKRKGKQASRPKSNPSKKRFNGNCYNCEKAGHKSTECRAPKKDKKKGQANMVENHEDVDDLCTMLFECNLEAFATYALVGPEETLSMGNVATAKIEGCGKIFLKMTSGKVVTLNNVLHVPEIRKNLVSDGLLVKNDFKCVFVSDKVVTSKNEMFVGKGYLTEGLFKLNRKMKYDGTVDKYKARLVVKGYRQREGFDYFDTYSPVTKITSILMLVALASVYGLKIHQMDVKMAFLNGELQEEIYIEQLEGFVVPGKEKKINECDKCVYIKNVPNHIVIIYLYVDDMLIMSNDIASINATKHLITRKFDMKDLRVADLILGIKIHKTSQGLTLSQSHYIKTVLEKFKYLGLKVAKTPIDVNLTLAKNKGQSISQLDYARLLGCLMYIMNCTRPDIACAISKLSRYTSNTGQSH